MTTSKKTKLNDFHERSGKEAANSDEDDFESPPKKYKKTEKIIVKVNKSKNEGVSSGSDTSDYSDFSAGGDNNILQARTFWAQKVAAQINQLPDDATLFDVEFKPALHSYRMKRGQIKTAEQVELAKRKKKSGGVDDRVASWIKFIKTNSKRVFINTIGNLDDNCWDITPSSGNEYADVKLDGENRQYHRVMHAIFNPTDVTKLESFIGNQPVYQVCHRCGRSRCGNRRHLCLGSSEFNNKQKECKNSCAVLCTHEPKCIFVNTDGLYLPCLNDPLNFPPLICNHPQQCRIYITTKPIISHRNHGLTPDNFL